MGIILGLMPVLLRLAMGLMDLFGATKEQKKAFGAKYAEIQKGMDESVAVWSQAQANTSEMEKWRAEQEALEAKPDDTPKPQA